MTRKEFRELVGQMALVFCFLMLQIVGVYFVFKDQL